MYNGKTYLQVSYQYHMLDHGDDVIIISKEFATLNEAYAAMEKVMPIGYEGDDGYDLEEWEQVISEKKDTDIFMQYNAQIDSEHNVLAQLSPVL